MDLRPYVEMIHQQLAVAAEAGGEEARMVAERLTAAVDSAVRLALQDALVAAAEEITCELAPGSVELRLRGRDPEFVVRQAPSPGGVPLGPGTEEAGASEAGLAFVLAPAATAAPEVATSAGAGPLIAEDHGGTARVNLRMPDQLKARAEQAAAHERMSLNTWLTKAVATALERTGLPRRDDSNASPRRQRVVGWAR